MNALQAVRGTHDLLPEESSAFQRLEATARLLFHGYGFQEIRTPTFESLSLFQRSLGETTDVVEKEMYVFEDRGGRLLALRPEGTAGVVRAFIEHHLDQVRPFQKLYYMGSMFRAERPQAGRYREFWQIGAEVFGNASPAADAELLALVHALFSAVGLSEFQIKLNSLGCRVCRPVFVEALTRYLRESKVPLCEDCQRRLGKNPLRTLDCKKDGPALKDAPSVESTWCAACRDHWSRVRRFLDEVKVPYVVSPRLVRGLDYYTRTVFEVTTSTLGAQDALAAGGRYDRLVKDLGGPDVPALGFALGCERTIEALKAGAGGSISKGEDSPFVFVAALGEAASGEAFRFLQELRSVFGAWDRPVRVDGGFFDKKIGAQLGLADRVGASVCVIFGEEEIAQGQVTLRDMKSGSQVRVARAQAVAALKERWIHA